MPRRARVVQPNAYYHVVNRGSLRARLFYSARDYRSFIRVLADTVDRFQLPLLSYCVMPNHWHLVLRPENAEHLSKSMHWLTCTHAHRWCHTHERSGPGPLYQGRYKAIHVQPDVHLMRACRYVERNALKAKFGDKLPTSLMRFIARERPVELGPLLRVAQRLVVDRHHRPDDAPRDPVARLRQAHERALEAAGLR